MGIMASTFLSLEKTLQHLITVAGGPGDHWGVVLYPPFSRSFEEEGVLQNTCILVP